MHISSVCMSMYAYKRTLVRTLRTYIHTHIDAYIVACVQAHVSHSLALSVHFHVYICMHLRICKHRSPRQIDRCPGKIQTHGQADTQTQTEIQKDTDTHAHPKYPARSRGEMLWHLVSRLSNRVGRERALEAPCLLPSTNP